MPKPRVVAVLVAIAALTTIGAAVEPEFSAERLRAHVTFLADDLLEKLRRARGDVVDVRKLHLCRRGSEAEQEKQGDCVLHAGSLRGT